MVVRADLPVGLQGAQILHAAGESADPRPPPGTRGVALVARDEIHLRCVDEALELAGVRHHLVIEDDGQAMAIGVNPTHDCTAIRKVLSRLKLMG